MISKETEDRLEAGVYVQKLKKYLQLEQAYNMTHNKIIEDMLAKFVASIFDKEKQLQDKSSPQPIGDSQPITDPKLNRLNNKIDAITKALSNIDMYLHAYPEDGEMKALLEVIYRWELSTRVAKEKYADELRYPQSSPQPMAGPDSVRPNQDNWGKAQPGRWEDAQPRKHAMPEPRKVPPPPLIKNEDKRPFANYRIWDNTSEKTLQQIHDIALEFVDIRKDNTLMLHLILRDMGYTFVSNIPPHKYNELISKLNKYEKEQEN